MYTTCLFCHSDLSANHFLSTFPVGRRLAFDPKKGRLWVICTRCGRWNLSPLEERWEAIDQAERLFREAFDAWFQSQLENPPEGVRRSLRRPSRAVRPGDADEDGPVERLRRAAYELAQWRDFRGEWTRQPFDRAAAIGPIIELVHRVADLSAKPS